MAGESGAVRGLGRGRGHRGCPGRRMGRAGARANGWLGENGLVGKVAGHDHLQCVDRSSTVERCVSLLAPGGRKDPQRWGTLKAKRLRSSPKHHSFRSKLRSTEGPVEALGGWGLSEVWQSLVD